MDDKIREEGQMNSLDHMASLGKAALTVGVGAALFYRGGGKHLLSKGASISERVLRDASNEIGSRSLKELTTKDVKEVYHSLIGSPDSALKRAREQAREGTILLRKDDPRNVLGVLQENYVRLMRDQERIIERKFQVHNAEIPTAREFVNRFAQDNPVLGRQIERFVSDVANHLDDLVSIDRIIQRHKLDKSLEKGQIDEIIEFLNKRMKDKEGFSQFMQEHQRVIDEAISIALDPDEIARVVGSASKPTGRQKFESALLGDQRATIDDLIANPEKFANNLIVDHVIDSRGKGKDVVKEAVTFLSDLKERIRNTKGDEKAEAFGQLFVDSALRKDADGVFHSFAEGLNASERLLDSFAGTMPGKIFKIRDMRERAKSPSFYYTSASGSIADPMLARLANKNDKESFLPDTDYMRILGRSYEFSSEGLRHEKALDDTYLISRYGTRPRLLNQMSGNVDYRIANNKAFRMLDIGQEGVPTILDDIRSRLNKFKDPSWSGNVIKNFLNNSHETKVLLDKYRTEGIDEEAASNIKGLIRQAKDLDLFFSKNTYELSSEAVNKLMDQSSGEARRMFELLTMNDEDMLRELLVKDSSSLRDITSHLNQGLISILGNYTRNPKRARDMISIKTNRGNFFGGTETAGFFETLRMEIGKEAFMRHAVESSATTKSYNFDAISELIDSAGLTGEVRRETRRLADWAVFQQATGINHRSLNKKEIDNLLDDANDVLEVFLEPKDSSQTNAEYFKQFRENLKLMSKDKISPLETSYSMFRDTEDIIASDRQSEWIHMRKMISPLDVIKDLNDTEKLKAFGKQFFAGRDNLEDVTTATLVPYFGVIRLSDALSKIGLSFSVTSTGSVGSLAKAIALKRAFPIVAGMTYYDYLSDMTGEVTGTTLTGAFASGLANIDLGFRRVTDATGLTEFLKDEKEINPFYSYWTGKEYMNYDERKDWYENGYSEMRKARWWSFGSINEFRGPEIQYYQPNYLRRAHSNWKDEALYDSVWEKWSRSWLPTPTAPLSPIRYLMNPYWLEEKHAEDRPYPMTGKMFTEETIWGPILNPTIGELIKPQKRMHTDRLDSNLVDVKALIEERNREHLSKAKDNEERHMIRLKDGVIEPVTYTTLDAPTPSERVLNVQIKNGEIQTISGGDYQSFTGVLPVQSYLDEFSPGSVEGIRAGTAFPGSPAAAGVGGGSGEAEVEGLSFRDEMMIRSDSGEMLPRIVSTIMNSVDPLSEIEQINRSIQVRAQAISSRPEEKGVVTPESIYRSQARYGSHILQNREAIADLKGLSSGDDFIGEMAYTTRFMAGIYGYGTFRLFPGEARTKIEDASTIYSPIRSYWDANLGGLGGGYFEIFRRFIPAYNHKVEKVNPLMNTMPDWMPERFRFGDPYTKVPKGEMRLPGRGYESIHELHPDEFGMYGAFDRFKILADISPYSHEYKVWRDIASKTVTDPELRDEMEKIRERVTEQSKKYDFHRYKFIGKSLERNVVTVEEVMNNNYFKVVGDDRIFRLAGIEVSGEDGENVLGQYLTPGMEVVMATDKNQYDGTNDDSYQSINASIYIDGQNLNRQLLKEGMARKRMNDYSAAAAQGQYTDFQIARGHLYEALSHAPIPYFQQKFFKIRDPLESYKHEMVYGTSYASWAFPVKSFLMPGIERSLMSDVEMAVGAGTLVLNQMIHNHSSSKAIKNAANAALMLTNRGAFIGGFLGMAVSGGGKATRVAAQIGAAGQMAGWLYTRSDQPIEGTIGFAALGAGIGHILKDIGIKKGALFGAAAGALITSGQTSLLHEGIDKTWIPQRTLDRWEMQEYFDRLEYIKYSGLYEKAARKAYLQEGTDIKRLVHQYEKSREENDKLREELNEYREIINRTYPEGDSRAERLLGEIDAKLKAIEDAEMLLTTGKWGRTALIYKQAMDSTIYGLREDASWAQLLRSIPRNERDHFMEFAKEKDPKKRAEILKYVSPYQKRALQIAWEEEPDKPESMRSFFSRHKLPEPTWSGWRPNVDLKNIEVKTIANEGMLLSDFGYYESQLRDPDVIFANNLNPNEENNPITLRANLIAALKGFGLTGVDVSVEPSSKEGIQVVADIARITSYNIQEKLKSMMSL